MILPAIYCVIAIAAWIDFLRRPPDGLANLGLMIVVWPAALLDLTMRSPADTERSALMPQKWGYYGDHGIFFWVSVISIASGLWLIGAFVDRRIAKAKGRH